MARIHHHLELGLGASDGDLHAASTGGQAVKPLHVLDLRPEPPLPCHAVHQEIKVRTFLHDPRVPRSAARTRRIFCPCSSVDQDARSDVEEDRAVKYRP